MPLELRIICRGQCLNYVKLWNSWCIVSTSWVMGPLTGMPVRMCIIDAVFCERCKPLFTHRYTDIAMLVLR